MRKGAGSRGRGDDCRSGEINTLQGTLSRTETTDPMDENRWVVIDYALGERCVCRWASCHTVQTARVALCAVFTRAAELQRERIDADEKAKEEREKREAADAEWRAKEKEGLAAYRQVRHAGRGRDTRCLQKENAYQALLAAKAEQGRELTNYLCASGQVREGAWHGERERCSCRTRPPHASPHSSRERASRRPSGVCPRRSRARRSRRWVGRGT